MPATNWETSNNRVLLVDDDELYLETMMAELEDRGFAVRGFPDGPSLFKELDRAPEADALLLDWTLPSMSGIDVLSAVRDRGIDVPVAFLTGRALVDYEHIAFGRGAIGFLVNVRSAMKRIRKKFLALDPAFAEIENFAAVGYAWRRPAADAG